MFIIDFETEKIKEVDNWQICEFVNGLIAKFCSYHKIIWITELENNIVWTEKTLCYYSAFFV
jgi:hypothetical protein